MSARNLAPPRPLPGWLALVASLALAFHLFTLAILALAAPSGPWPTPFGPSQALPPPFAGQIGEVTTRYYLAPLALSHNYHFLGNRPDAPGIFFEVKLKDAQGETIDTVRVPSPKDNAFVGYRHRLLAEGLGDDEPIQAPRGEVIPAPKQQMEKVKIWDLAGENRLTLREVDVHLIPKDRPVSRPREWSLLLAQSYLRYLCRERGAAAAELIRHSRQPVLPAILFLEEPPPGTFDTLVSTFEEYRSEN